MILVAVRHTEDQRGREMWAVEICGLHYFGFPSQERAEEVAGAMNGRLQRALDAAAVNWHREFKRTESEVADLRAKLAIAEEELLEARGLYEQARQERDQARRDRDRLDHRIAELRSENA